MTQKKFHRNAVAVWNGSLKDGSGTISTDSQVLNFTPFSFSTRFGNLNGTNPEELVAAAHAACFTMAFSHEMKKFDLFPTEIETHASVFLENNGDGWTIKEVHLQVWTPGEESEQKIREAAEIAKQKLSHIKTLKRGYYFKSRNKKSKILRLSLVDLIKINKEKFMAIELPALPFATSDLEPYISQRTLEFHYGKHHKHYVDTVNELIDGTSLDKKGIEEIMFASFKKKEKLYNNAAQVWNHTFFWSCMDRGMSPSLELKKTMRQYFGSFDDFKSDFEMECKGLFGSGYVWLVKDKKGKLKIKSLGNAGNPLVELGETPIMTCDVWEHAYYLDYQNERNKFIENFWNVVNWDFVEENLNAESRNKMQLRVAG